MNSKNIIHHNGEEYIQVTPSKRLFNSTMVHETVTRGDIFAVRIRDNLLTILPRGLNPIQQQMQLDTENRKAKQEQERKIAEAEKAIQDMRVQLTLQMKTLKELKGEL